VLQTEPGEEYPIIRSGPSLMVRLDASLIDAAQLFKNAANVSNQLPALIQRLHRSADTFDNMSNNLSRAGGKFSDETLPEVHQLVTELRDITSSLQRFGYQLEQNPSILLYGKPSTKRGPGE
jgi:ABC-type transporter Mla subunit MlaD